jgi:hypothetical protein
MLKKPNKPKYKALPKAPKMTASKESWKSYENKVKAITTENQKVKAEYEKKLRAYEAEIKQREKIKDKARNSKL